MRLYHTLCRVEELDLSCACNCIAQYAYHNYKKESLLRQVEANTRGNRQEDNLGSLVCSHLTLEANLVGCRIHPVRNLGIDSRTCDKGYLCTTAFAFEKWDLQKKGVFMDFLKEMRFNPFDYSIKMRSGELVHLFQRN